MMTKTISKLPLAFLVLTVVTGCQRREKAFEEAINWYYFETNKNPGAGQLHVGVVDILEYIQINDTTFVLAHIEGTYAPPPLPTDPEASSTDHKLWFLMVKEKNRYVVAGIRDPNKYSP
jgi:hypothetical protein